MSQYATAHEIHLPDGTLYTEVQGEGPAILFLHGWALDSRMWQKQADALSAAYKVITIDRRGFGRTTAPPDLSRETGDIITVLNALDVDRCALVGMSQGGRVALRFAYQYPERLWALVLMGAPLDGFSPLPSKEEAIPLSEYRALAVAGDIDAIRDAWRGHPLMAFPLWADRTLLDAMVDAYRGEDLLHYAEAQDMTARLKEINVPALALTGEYDTSWLHLVADAIAYGMPRAERDRLPDAGHLGNLTHTAAFNDRVRRFLSKHAPRHETRTPSVLGHSRG